MRTNSFLIMGNVATGDIVYFTDKLDVEISKYQQDLGSKVKATACFANLVACVRWCYFTAALLIDMLNNCNFMFEQINCSISQRM